MDRGISVDFIQLQDLTPENDFIIINVNISGLSPSSAKRHIARVHEGLKLCRMLESKGINYTIVGCRDDGNNGIVVNYEHNNKPENKPEKEAPVQKSMGLDELFKMD